MSDRKGKYTYMFTGRKSYIAILVFLAVFGIFLSPSALPAEYTLILREGRNLVSVPLAPYDSSIQGVLGGIGGDLLDVWGYEQNDAADPWKHYCPGYDAYNDLSDIVRGRGYYIIIKEGVDRCVLTVSGSYDNTDLEWNLKEGWNVVGWPFLYTADITEALTGLAFGVDYDQVSRIDPVTKKQEDFFNDFDIDQFDSFEPGRAYYIHCLKPGVVSFGDMFHVRIETPADDTYVSTPAVTVSGYVSEAAAQVTVNGVAAVVADNIFEAVITLQEGLNNVTAVAEGTSGRGDDSITVFLDTSPPETPDVFDDGATLSTTTELSARWSECHDPDSGIAGYEYAIGTSAGSADVTGWVEAGPNTAMRRMGLSLVQGRTYYVSVRAVNNAGMRGGTGYSDGITVDQNMPFISGVTPPDCSNVFRGGSVVLTVTAEDMDGDELLYRMSWDSGEPTGWQAEPFFDLFAGGPEDGYHQITIDVSDQIGGYDTETVRLYMMPQPVALPPDEF